MELRERQPLSKAHLPVAKLEALPIWRLADEPWLVALVPLIPPIVLYCIIKNMFFFTPPHR
jgi:hypothetical protein